MFYVGGAVGMRYMGAYAAGTTYFPNDIVTLSGTAYIATAVSTGNTPTNTSFFQPFVPGASAASFASDQKWSTD